MKNRTIPFLFISAALVALVVGLLFGVIGGFQYLLPDFLKENLSFNKTRPLHVSLVITWIFTCAVGGIYYYLPIVSNKKLYSASIANLHFGLLIITGLTILICYYSGNFGGREYLEFPPVLAIPMLLTWILFMINYFKTINKKIREWPIYLWMWTTGVVFFMITFLESYLWTFPFFRDNIVRDVTIQWKANGSMVGSWNMLVYGTGFYLMEQISGNKETANSRLTFFFYFLGLTNLMFNWGHHTYIVPAASWVKNVAYVISMTELLILGSIIWNWRKTLTEAQKNFHIIPYRFLAAADAWIFLNLTLAIFMSVPAINLYTHGTHITVAHAMGATIGINTMILFASVFYIISKADENFIVANSKKLKSGFWITSISLLVFWIALLGAGVTKALQNQIGVTGNFQLMMGKLSPWFHLFTAAGLTLFIGIALLVIPALRKTISTITA